MATENENMIQPFGFAEMYEWAEVQDQSRRIGRMVTFDEHQHDKIRLAHDDDEIIGVTTVCNTITSDDPDEWKYAYACNEYGDLFLQRERLAVGQKEYDQLIEMNYIRTFPWEHFIKIPSQNLDTSKKYVKRSVRPEWNRVNLIGKCIVKASDDVRSGMYCTVYKGKIKDLWGTVIPWEEGMTSKKFYVLERLSKTTVLILVK